VLALAGQRHKQAVRFLIEQARHVLDTLRHGTVDLVGLADEIA
jgi:hypothetical protein